MRIRLNKIQCGGVSVMFNKRIVVPLICVATLSTGYTSVSFAANWLTLQGTESLSATGRAKVWGFVQAQFQKDYSAANASNTYVPAKLIGPNLTAQDMFNVNRARIGVRGNSMSIGSKFNYFLLLEAGNNGITAGAGHVKATDASVTSTHIPYLKIRAGLFKYPGSEEGLQAIHSFDYINFSTVTNQLMLERFPNDDNFTKNVENTGNTDAQPLGTSPSGFEKPVGAFRDVGIQIFDTINYLDYEISYAAMMGNGNGLNFGDNNGNKTLYGYFATEKVFSGQGARRQGVKFFAWYQKGLRAYDTNFINSTTSNAANSRTYAHYNRERSGLGFKFLKNSYRVSAEYMRGTGMIFLGSHKESFDMNAPLVNDGDGLSGKANGWYIDGGWRVFETKFEIDARYDVYNRLTGDALEVNFSTFTLGAQYFMNKKTRLAINYAIRNASSANNNANLENNLSGIGGRAGIQITTIF